MPEHVELRVPITGSTIKLTIDPAEVNKVIAAAILSSGIGEAVKKHAEDFLVDPQKYGDPVKKAVREEMSQMIVQLLREEPFRALVRERVKAALTERVLNETVEMVVQRVTRGF
jgi:hypothetical protein